MTDTVTWGFTHKIATRDGDTITAECGRSATGAPGWRDQGFYCPDCYGLPEPPSTGATFPITYGRRNT